ncbi:Uu.00g117550.m01.CDS01 [Anthostomella pinea]|uniref:Uu.00g117550.m01.CDS01 n=1 Tax=Anthostomella pinea TaxID=933095 RepID=A0AAI8VGY8_9PEZI|nr:Uu.00g117550.m01.CDS01 [Anthostomella pinea]
MSASLLLLSLLLFSDSALSQPPSTQPLLVYNCAKMPSICRNVDQRNTLQVVPGVPAAGRLGLLDPGKNGGNDYITLTYDTSAGMLPANPAGKKQILARK